MHNGLSSIAVVFLVFLVFLTACGGGGDSGDGSGGGSITTSVALPETGQTICTNATGVAVLCAGTGQDGEHLAGVAWPSPRFTAGTGATVDCVTDNLTGLMWVRAPGAIPVTWTAALAEANALTLCGFGDWRLPNVNELESLVNSGVANQATFLNTQGFSGVLAGAYWSSSSVAGGAAAFAWVVVMAGGVVSNSGKSTSFLVWPVRAGQ